MDAVIVWFRQDLRLQDNPALQAAIQTGKPVIPLYILDKETSGIRIHGGAQRWWLHHSLAALDNDLRQKGSRLILRTGKAEEVLKAVLAGSQASELYWNRCYEPFAIQRDQLLKQYFTNAGFTVKSFNSALLFEPWKILNLKKEPFKVFSHFWKACLKNLPYPEDMIMHLAKLYSPRQWPPSELLEDWSLLPENPDWATRFPEFWQPGEKGAWIKLGAFMDHAVLHYKNDRHYPAIEGTSRLSPHLHFGEISPLQIIRFFQKAFPTGFNAGSECYIKELGWREFSYYLLYHFPQLPCQDFRPEFNHFQWDDNKDYLRKWQQGLTGFPIVDAGMRQLWATGWMHNRVRMIVASFLTKDLFINWKVGENWFWDTLVDADQANNAASWQWVAGSGADAAPFFRIFNPVLQGEKFDPKGEYIRQWVPELNDMPASFIHKPWQAPSKILQLARVQLGKDYPEPVIQHDIKRQQALERYQAMKLKYNLFK